MREGLQGVVRAIEDGERFLIAAHENPDGDAVASSAGVAHIAARLGKRATIYNASALPRRFDWVELGAHWTTEMPDASEYDWLICLDAGVPERMGAELADRYEKSRTAVIDHHPGNEGFGAVNWIDPARPATAEMIGQLAEALGLTLDGALGQAVLLGIITDTGNFRYGNTTVGCLEMAARVVRTGVSMSEVNVRLDQGNSPAMLKAWGRALSGAKEWFDGRLRLCRVSLEDFAATGAGREDVDGLVNMVRDVRGVLVGGMLREDAPGRVKLSLRSYGEVDVRVMCEKFGGGGHRNAAGATIHAGLDDAERLVVQVVREALGL